MSVWVPAGPVADAGGVTVEFVYRKFLRPGWIVGHLLVVLAALVCLRLGRWQWDRMHEGGTVQNLGYAILWPVFGAAFLYMWFRFLQLETLKDAEDDAELTALAAGDVAEPSSAAPGPGLPDDAGPARPAPATPVAAGRAGVAPGPCERSDLPQTELTPDGISSPPGTSADVAVSIPVDDVGGQSLGGQDVGGQNVGGEREPEPVARGPLSSRGLPSRGITIAVSTVGDDDQDQDPELAAYNRALAALAEKDS